MKLGWWLAAYTEGTSDDEMTTRLLFKKI